MALIFIDGKVIMVNNDTQNGIQLVNGAVWPIKATITQPTPESIESFEKSYVFVS
jgi:hypothetical protein